ncbi:MAG: hypothetical protein RIC55_30185 [Pirellulaceae bacterium]
MKCSKTLTLSAIVVALLLASLLAALPLTHAVDDAAPSPAAPSSAAPSSAERPETLAEIRDRLEQMSAQEKQELQGKSTRFYELPEGEQERLREMHKQLNAHPESARLRQVMDRYAQWLRTLPSGERAELLSLSEEERIPRIRELMQQHEAQQFHRLVSSKLPAHDLRSIYEWLNDIAQRHEKEILAEASDEFRRRYGEEEDDESRRRRMLVFALTSRRGDLPFVQTTDVEQLVDRLSPEARDALAEMRTAEDRGRLLRDWVRGAIFARMNPPVSEEKLREFFVNELDSEQRQRLESLSAEQMQQELQRMYNFSRFRREDGRGRPPGPWGGGRGFGRSGGGRGRGPGSGDRPPPGDRPQDGADRPGDGPPGGGPPGGPAGGGRFRPGGERGRPGFGPQGRPFERPPNGRPLEAPDAPDPKARESETSDSETSDSASPSREQ